MPRFRKLLGYVILNLKLFTLLFYKLSFYHFCLSSFGFVSFSISSVTTSICVLFIFCLLCLPLCQILETNAQDKGLNTDNLVIKHIKADYGSRIWHRGRQSRQKMKRTHIEVVTEEMEKETKPKEDKQK